MKYYCYTASLFIYLLFDVFRLAIRNYVMRAIGIEAEAIITYLIRAWMDNNRHIYRRIRNMIVHGSIADVYMLIIAIIIFSPSLDHNVDWFQLVWLIDERL